MSKDTPATRLSGLHGDPNSNLHGWHSAQQKERKIKKAVDKKAGVKWQRHRENQEGDLWPTFDSWLEPHLGKGKCYRAARDEERKVCGLKPELGPVWVFWLKKWEDDMSWFSVPRQLKRGLGYGTRKIKDRDKLSPGDKRKRASTDILRRTNELRPDHSRALLKMCEAGKTAEVEALLDEFVWRSARRWEDLNPGRRCDHLGLHLDSGHVHRDVWHCGITEHKDAAAPGGIRRDRERYRIYGVGPGSTAFIRHVNVLTQEFGKLDESVKFTNTEMNANIRRAEEQNGCYPRDAKFNEWLDDWMWQELLKIDGAIAARARRDYAKHVREGYRQKKLGIHLTAEKTEINTLRQERADVASFLNQMDLPVSDRAVMESKDSIIEKVRVLDDYHRAAKTKMMGELNALNYVLNPTGDENIVDAGMRVADETTLLRKTINELNLAIIFLLKAVSNVLTLDLRKTLIKKFPNVFGNGNLDLDDHTFEK